MECSSESGVNNIFYSGLCSFRYTGYLRSGAVETDAFLLVASQTIL